MGITKNNMKRTRDEREPLEEALPLDTPFVINVDPASACNFSCDYCFHAIGNKMGKKGIMSWSLYKQIVHNILEFPSQVKTLRLYAFGEPLLNSRFPDMIKMAKDLDATRDIDTTTNGSLLTTKLNREIISAGLDRINISVMGMNSNQYLKFAHRSVNFDRYVDNIADLYHNRGDCVVFIKINGDLLSLSDQQEFVHTFHKISDGFAIEHVMNCWYDIDMGNIKKNENVGVYGDPLTYVEVCPYIFYSFCVQYDGVVSACFLDWNRKLVVGDVVNDNLVDIWNGLTMASYRREMLLKKRNKIAICKDCDQLRAGEPVNIDHIAEELLEKL
jgi:MoaA/NifB/PqqE/SkfB family radical SAM enzyme